MEKNYLTNEEFCFYFLRIKSQILLTHVVVGT